MPSKHTVVVSLDAETERIVNNLGGNRSEWIRDAIRYRHGPGLDYEAMEALADARRRNLHNVTRILHKLVACVEEFGEPIPDKFTKAAMKEAKEWLELR